VAKRPTRSSASLAAPDLPSLTCGPQKLLRAGERSARKRVPDATEIPAVLMVCFGCHCGFHRKIVRRQIRGLILLPCPGSAPISCVRDSPNRRHQCHVGDYGRRRGIKPSDVVIGGSRTCWLSLRLCPLPALIAAGSRARGTSSPYARRAPHSRQSQRYWPAGHARLDAVPCTSRPSARMRVPMRRPGSTAGCRLPRIGGI